MYGGAIFAIIVVMLFATGLIILDFTVKILDKDNPEEIISRVASCSDTCSSLGMAQYVIDMQATGQCKCIGNVGR